MVDKMLQSWRLVIATAVLLALAGLVAVLTMPRQEDPFFPYRVGLITTVFPGADPARVAKLVVEPLAEELAQVEDVYFTNTVARTGVALTTILLNDTVYETDRAWDRVRRAIDRAKKQFPDGVHEPDLNDRLMTTSTVTLSVTGSDDPLELVAAAKKLKAKVLRLGGISRVDLYGDPGEQITIAVDDAVTTRLGGQPQLLAQQLQQRSQIIPGGSVILAGNTVTLRPETEFRSVEEIRNTPIRLPSGELLPLSSFARVWHGPAEPPAQKMWFDGVRAVAVDVILVPDAVNMSQFGKDIRALVESVRDEFAPLEIHETFFQPDRVDKRLGNLGGNLLLSVVIIIGILFLAMGLRLGLIVATILPLVTLVAVAVYAIGGGVLHQVAVIGTVVALGILVDNAIVIVENLQWRLDQGMSRLQAAAKSIKELAGPLGSSTGTTLAAFVPLLMSKGNTADFTRGIPLMIMLALLISYFFAVSVLPIVAMNLLKPRPERVTKTTLLERFGGWAGRASARHAWVVVIVVGMIIGGTIFLGKFMNFQFFPSADRDQVVMELKLPEGTHFDVTETAAERLEEGLRTLPDVHAVHRFVGDSGPRFYYNLIGKQRAPHQARLVAKTTGVAGNFRILEWARAFVAEELPDAELVAKVLGQGPPLEAPIEIRVYNDDPRALAQATEQVYNVIRNTAGAADTRHTLGLGVPNVSYEIDDAVAARYGLSRVEVARALFGRTQGITVAQYRGGDDPVDIKIRSLEGERFALDKLDGVNVYTPQGQAVPLAQLVRRSIDWQPAAIRYRNQVRTATVFSQMDDGVAFSQVLNKILPQLKDLDLPTGTDWEVGGEQEESGNANSAIAQTAPLGLTLLLFFLILEFNSFRRLGIVMLTVPLCAVGVIPGLVFTGSPFGFQSLTGVIALVGIVVNNAIVLIDVLDRNLESGLSLSESIENAVRRRTRPIFLTSLTTIAGLIPLALFGGTMWPPMAWAIISGLTASTILTLFLVPAMCKLTLSEPKHGSKSGLQKATATVAAVLFGIALWSTPAPSFADDSMGEWQPVLPEDVVAVEAAPLAETVAETVAITHAAPVDNAVSIAPEVGGLRCVQTPAQATAAAEKITLAEAMQRGRQRPQVMAEVAQLVIAQQQIELNRRARRWPQLSVDAFLARSNEVGEFSTPAGNFPVGKRSKSGVTVELTQPLIDPAFNRSMQAAEFSAAAQQAKLQHVEDQAAVTAAQLMLQYFALGSQAKAATEGLQSLNAQHTRVTNLVTGGRALKADELQVKLAHDQLCHSVKTLQAGQQATYQALLQALAMDQQPELVVPENLVLTLPALPLVADAVLPQAIAQRGDLQALEQQVSALQQQLAVLNTEYLPRLDAQLSYIQSSGQVSTPEEEVRGVLAMTWQPFASATTAPREAILQQQITALQAQYAEARRGVRIQLIQAHADYHIAQNAIELAKTGLQSANLTLQTRQARYQGGRATIDEVLAAEAAAQQQREQANEAAYQVITAWLQYQLAAGHTIQLPE